MKLFEYIDLMDKPYDIFYTDSVASPLHWHYYCEILYIRKGSILLICNNDSFTLQSGDICYIYPLVLHETQPVNNDDEVDYAVIKFDIHTINIPQPFLEGIYNYFVNNTGEKENCLIIKSDSLPNDFPKLISNTVDEYNEKKEFSALQIQANIYSILISIARLTDKTIQVNAGKTSEDLSLNNILEYIDTHSSEPLNIQELARKCNMSYSYFAKKFKENFGRSCKDYISYIRLKKAEELLLHSNYNITYIANETGFFDSSHFIREYKRWKKTTPLKHRQSKKG